MRLVVDHGEALEADLRREYRVDLRDLWRDGGDLDWRLLRVYVHGLPPAGTAVARSIHGVQGGEWTDTHEMLKLLANAATRHAWAFLEVNRDEKKSRPIPVPEPIRGPFDPAPEDEGEVEARNAKGVPVATTAETTLAVLAGAL